MPQSVLLGEAVHLECVYTYSGSPYLYWYVQYPGKSPTMLINDLMQEQQKGFSAKIDKTNTSFHMKKDHAELTDSGVYFCAISDNNLRIIFGSGTKLRVLPNIEHCDNNSGNKITFGKGTGLDVRPRIPESTVPSMYQLKSNKKIEGMPNTVCLATDFPPPDNYLKAFVKKAEANLTNRVMLDSSDDMWRYSAVLWDDGLSEDYTCSMKYKENTYDVQKPKASDTDICSPSSLEENFETDEKMNTVSLNILGLRLITIKAIIFNMIITFRLWSS
ncbi:T cell receptor alpha chain MC.7.G5-like [Pelodytes ibericus]